MHKIAKTYARNIDIGAFFDIIHFVYYAIFRQFLRSVWCELLAWNVFWNEKERRIIVMTKIDLADKEITKEWKVEHYDSGVLLK